MGTYPLSINECQRSVDKTSCIIASSSAQRLHHVCCILCNCLPLCVLEKGITILEGGHSDRSKGLIESTSSDFRSQIRK